VEAEQAQRQNEVQIATLSGNLRELDALPKSPPSSKQIADAQLKTVLARWMEATEQPPAPTRSLKLTPKAEQLARIDERQKYQEALDASLSLAKARLASARPGPLDDWLHEVHSK